MNIFRYICFLYVWTESSGESEMATEYSNCMYTETAVGNHWQLERMKEWDHRICCRLLYIYVKIFVINFLIVIFIS